jgi:hypothetical protein
MGTTVRWLAVWFQAFTWRLSWQSDAVAPFDVTVSPPTFEWAKRSEKVARFSGSPTTTPTGAYRFAPSTGT